MPAVIYQGNAQSPNSTAKNSAADKIRIDNAALTPDGSQIRGRQHAWIWLDDVILRKLTDRWARILIRQRLLYRHR